MANTMHYLQPDELKKLLEVAAESKRNVAMILLSYRHGLRASELCGLTLADVDEANDRLIVTARKTRRKGGSKYYEAFRPKDSFGASDLAAIHSYMKERAEFEHAKTCPALFLSRKGDAMLAHSWTTAFKNIAIEAGLRREVQHPHVLRHTAAMNCIDRDVPLHLVSSVLRHASLASLTPYVKPKQEDVDKAAIKAFAKF
jgi:site-specific recombinase XerD